MVFNALSGRFLGWTILFVVISEVLIFVPSIARFRLDYLQTGWIWPAGVTCPAGDARRDAGPRPRGGAARHRRGLERGAAPGRRRELVLASHLPALVVETFDIRDPELTTLMRDALRVYAARSDRIIRVIGRPSQSARSEIEVTLHDWPSIAIIVYGLLYPLPVARHLGGVGGVAPLRGAALLRAADQPGGRAHDPLPGRPRGREPDHRAAGGARELVQAEIALHDLQVRLTGPRGRRSGWRRLGGDRQDQPRPAQPSDHGADPRRPIDASTDPGVKRTARSSELALPRHQPLRAHADLRSGRGAAARAGGLPSCSAGVGGAGRRAAGHARLRRLRRRGPGDLKVRADADQVFRVLSNLVRNAAQAIEAAGHNGPHHRGAGGGGPDRIRGSDPGPGLPQKARDNLFQPFRGGVRPGAGGLGPVIAAELVRGRGGDAGAGADRGRGAGVSHRAAGAPGVSAS